MVCGMSGRDAGVFWGRRRMLVGIERAGRRRLASRSSDVDDAFCFCSRNNLELASWDSR